MTSARTRIRKWTGISIVLTLLLTVSHVALAAQKLTVWVGDGDMRLREYQFVAQLFEDQNPDIQVEVLGQSGNQTQVMEKLTLAIASGAAPDVTWVEGSTVVELAAQGLLTDLTPTLKDLRFAPADTLEMTYNGRIWAVPYHTAARGLFKRVDLFEQAGLNPNLDPTTLEQLYAWNQKLIKMNPDGRYSQVGLVPWVGNWGAPAWIWTFGGKLLEVEGTKIRPTATYVKNIEAFEWIRTWAQAYGNMLPVAAGHAGFQNGTVAMSMESTSSVNRFIAAGVPFTTGRVPNPPGGQNGTWGGGTAVAVPRNAPNLQLALKLARFFGETQTQIQRFGFAPDVLPANWQALLSVGRKLSKEWQPLLDQFPEARARTPLWIDYFVKYLNPAMNQVVSGAKTPQQALGDVQVIMEARYLEMFGK